MKKIFKLAMLPVKLVWYLVLLPIRLILFLCRPLITKFKRSNLYNFFVEVPQDRPVVDVAVEAFQSPSVFLEQFEEIRKHLLRSILFLIFSVFFAFYFTQQIIDYIASPIGGIQNLQAIEVTESIGVFMKVSLMAGLAMAIPYITFEAWLFVAPGLMPKARIMSLITIPFALVFFLSGVAFAYYVLLPNALMFLLDFMGVSTKLRPQSYFDFVIGILFWIGLSFEFPLVIFGISTTGWLKPSFLWKQWRLAVVLIAVISAMVTPTVDPVNMALVMAPMIGLYFVSIFFSWLANLTVSTN